MLSGMRARGRKMLRAAVRLTGVVTAIAVAYLSLNAATSLDQLREPEVRTTMSITQTAPVAAMVANSSASAFVGAFAGGTAPQWNVRAAVNGTRVQVDIMLGIPSDPFTTGGASSVDTDNGSGDLTSPVTIYMELPYDNGDFRTYLPDVPRAAQLEYLPPSGDSRACASWTLPDGTKGSTAPVILHDFKTIDKLLRCTIPAIGHFTSLSVGANSLWKPKSLTPNAAGSSYFALVPVSQPVTDLGDDIGRGTATPVTASPLTLSTIVFGNEQIAGIDSSANEAGEILQTTEMAQGGTAVVRLVEPGVESRTNTYIQVLWIIVGIMLAFVPTGLLSAWKVLAVGGGSAAKQSTTR
jgi:hypothetical protein